jgi:hypothetical protein
VGHGAASQIRKRAQNEVKNVGCLFKIPALSNYILKCRMKADNIFINSNANDQK